MGSSSLFHSSTARELISHDVFLSFRGEDTRCGFTSHLHAALMRQGIKAFMDRDLERGNEISSTLSRVIEGSKISVIIFSRSYASSIWTLTELEKIMECKRTKAQIVIPIFYHIDPSDVRNQTGSYAVAFARHRKCFKANINHRVQKWRDNMTEAANLSGYCSTKWPLESELVEEIAIDVKKKLEYGGEQENENSQNSFHTCNPEDSQSQDFVDAQNPQVNHNFDGFFGSLSSHCCSVIKCAICHVQRTINGKNLLFTETMSSSMKQYCKEARESQRAMENTSPFDYNHTSHMVRQARRRAEIARLRGLHKTHVKAGGIDQEQK